VVVVVGGSVWVVCGGGAVAVFVGCGFDLVGPLCGWMSDCVAVVVGVAVADDVETVTTTVDTWVLTVVDTDDETAGGTVSARASISCR
jgi:hypothetical protein